MRRKIFTLLTLLLTVCSGAWADETIFSATSTTTSDTNISANTTNQAITAAQATITGGSMTASNSGSKANKFLGQAGESGNKKAAFVYSSSSQTFTITLDEALEAGDEIDFLVYTSSSDKKTVGLILNGSITREVTMGTTNAWTSVETYTVQTGDALIGQTVIALTRSQGNGTYFTDFTITRATTHNVTVNVNNALYGSASAATSVIGEGKTTIITAVPNSGYKVASWAVSGEGASIDPSGDSNSLTTTLTMGTADATVTCTFAAAATYTISYGAGSADGVTGSRDSETKTESVAFTLPSTAVFTRTGYIQTGWNTNADGTSGTHYDLGGSYTTDADQTFYPEWTAVDYSFAPSASSGSISDGDVITTSTGGKMVATLSSIGTTGTTLAYTSFPVSEVSYNGVQFGTSGYCGVTVKLDKQMQAGTIIYMTWYATGNTGRGFYLGTSDGTNVDTSTFATSTADAINKASYTVQAGDGLAGTNSFTIKRYNTAYLISVTVVNCADVYAITPAKTMTTYCNAEALNFTGVEGLTAYVVSAAENGSATLTPVTDVPAVTGLILQGTAGTTYYVPVGSATTLGTTNKLVGVTTATAIDAWTEGSVYNYVLSDGAFHRAEAGTLPAGKAYLHCDSDPTAGAPQLMIDFDGISTGINAVNGSEFKVDGEYYNLNGQRVAQPTKGLYIVNGKKVVIK